MTGSGVEGVTLMVDEARASMIGTSIGSGSVRITAHSYDVDGNQTGVELGYWAHPDRGGVPTVGDLLHVTIERAAS
jgi:hypothetical protein